MGRGCPPTRVSDAGARHQDRSKARPRTWAEAGRAVAGGRGRQEIGNGMLRNPCSLSPVPASSRSHHISETAQAVHSPTSFLVPEAQSQVHPAIGNTCGAECAARSRRGVQPAVGGFRVCPAGSRWPPSWDGQGAWPALTPTSLEETTNSRWHVAGFTRAPSKHVPSTGN